MTFGLHGHYSGTAQVTAMDRAKMTAQAVAYGKRGR
jgi:hypothetical protein